MNKRKQRTENLRKAIKNMDTYDYVTNTIEQHNFEKLVRSGVIVCGLETSRNKEFSGFSAGTTQMGKPKKPH